MKPYFFIVVIFTLVSCDDKKTPDNIFYSNAIPIYNQAYQQNFEVDKIDYIKDNEIGAYISIGTGETYREDFEVMEPYLVSSVWGDWPDEYFVNSTSTGVVEIIKERIDKLAEWEFDWVEFDNMDWIYDDELRNIYGFEVTQSEGVAYYQTLCDYVHSKGMKCMAKNTVIGASNFDGVLYESFNDNKNWWEQSGAQSFLNEGKLVIVNHYNEINCGQVYSEYKGIYNNNLSFICEDSNLKKYIHFNQ